MSATCNACQGLGTVHTHIGGEQGCGSVHRSRQPLLITTHTNNQNVVLDVSAAKNWFVECEHSPVTFELVNASKSGRRGTIVVKNDRNDGEAVELSYSTSSVIVVGSHALPVSIPNTRHIVIEYTISGPTNIVPILRVDHQIT